MCFFFQIGLSFVLIGPSDAHDSYDRSGSYNKGYAGPGGPPPPPPPPYGMGPSSRGQCGGRGCGGGCSRGNCGGVGDQSYQGIGAQQNGVLPATQQPQYSPATQNPVLPATQQNQVMPGFAPQVTPNPIAQSQVLPTRLPAAGVTVPPVQFPENQTLLPPTEKVDLVPLPPVALPDGSKILPNGHVRFPNATILLSRYIRGAARPVARLPSGTLMFPDNTTKAAGTVTTFPAPGFPLTATSEATSYPSMLLPNSSIVYRNGSIVTPGEKMLPTTFARSTKPTITVTY